MQTTKQTCQIQVRQASQQDAESVAFIQIASLQSAYHGMVPVSFLKSMSLTDTVDEWTKKLADRQSRIWLVERNDEALGFVCLGESRDMDEEPASTAEIYDLHVMPSAVGRGLGSLLLKQAISDAIHNGFAECTAWTLTQNHPARSFFEDRAFMADSTCETLEFGAQPVMQMRYRMNLN